MKTKYRLLRINKRAVEDKVRSRPPGYKAAIYEAAIDETETHLYIPESEYDKLVERYGTDPKVGTELKRLVSWFAWAVRATDCDECFNREQAMNLWGPEGCERRMDRIQRWLKHSAMSHGILYNRTIATQLIRQAIANARAKQNGKAI